nr:MAG TPA: hypothetical protein [Caudoviricetes sp.]DAP54838.1 MAG TPA: hypothetical protein [Caudoviricetes sp.]DAQ95590.1 MAG TPA: hypothetical protein [Caudoviricetes sp.]DAT19351.1 MAG TPA: hypothetical protein [Caudoviricetes sp.]DAV89608.1 MAG TPA: hypothetical protein [Caudoviricetes sp.]
MFLAISALRSLVFTFYHLVSFRTLKLYTAFSPLSTTLGNFFIFFRFSSCFFETLC